MTLFGTVSNVELSAQTEVINEVDFVAPAVGKAARNFSCVSTVVERSARAEFCSRRFNTRRDTRVLESLYTRNQYSSRHGMVQEVLDGHVRQGRRAIFQ